MDVAARLTSKGQLTVPKSVREALGLREGDSVVFHLEGSRAVLARDAGPPRARRQRRRSGGQARHALERGAAPHPSQPGPVPTVRAFVDTSVLVRHLTGDPPDLAARATRFLAQADELLLADLIVAETVYVLESFYDVERPQVAEAVRAMVSFEALRVVDPELLLRAVEVYETDRLDFAEAYLVAAAERSGVGVVASFDRSIDRITTVTRLEPPNVPSTDPNT